MSELKDVKLSVNESELVRFVQVLSEKTKILGKVGTYEFRNSRGSSWDQGGFIGSVYDLSEISRALDVEPYICRAVDKISEQIVKEGFMLSGPDDQMVNYVKNRLFEISLATGITVEQTFREIARSLVTYHNAYIIFRRDEGRSTGKKIKLYGKVLNPIAGLFVADPTTMESIVDKYGTVKKWKQRIASLLTLSGKDEDRVFNTEDVLHISVNRKPGYTQGTPFILPVLDDVRALRKLEELVVLLASKEAFPLYHYKVGLENAPAILYDDGSTEVDQVLSTVQSLPQQGFVVSNERLSINLVSRNGSALDLKPYMEYFEGRVLSGLRLSDIDLGRASSINRGSATTVSKNMQDAAKNYQQILSDFLTFKLILPILLEGEFDVTMDNMVKLEFPPIDMEELRAHQTHGLNLFNSSAIDLDELRNEYLNKKPMTPEQLSNTVMEFKLKHDLQIAGAKASSISSSSSKSTSGASLVRNITQPRNQHKISPTKPKIAANDYLDIVTDYISEIKSALVAAKNLEESKPYIQSSVHDMIEDCVSHTKTSISNKIKEGWEASKGEFETTHKDAESEVDYIGSRALDRFFKNFVYKSYWKVIDDYLEAIYSSLDKEEIDTRYVKYLEDVRSAVINLIPTQEETAYRFGYASYAKRMGYKSIEVLDKDNNVSRTIPLNQIIYTNLLPKESDKKLRQIDNSDEI